MAGSPGTLHQTRHTFGRADLQHPLHRRKIDTQIQTGRTDDGLKPALLESGFNPVAHLFVERAMMHGDQPGPLWPRIQNRLIPKLSLRASIGEHQGTVAAFQLA